MKILLIQPKMNKRPMDTNLKLRMSPSLALLTIANLIPDEHEVIICNENIEKADTHSNVDLVGITITLDVLPRAIALSAEFQKRGIPVVAGGIHVTCAPEQCRPYFTALSIGPAERVWANIVEDTQNGCLKREYCDVENFCGAEIVSPKYSLLKDQAYLFTNVVLTSRGCPNRCSFCYNSCKNRLYLLRPIPDVIRDIQALNTRHVYFIDDNFIGNPAYTRDLLHAISGMNLVWNAAVTTKILDYPDLLDLMAETGCQSLFIGFESINTSSLESVNKDNKVSVYESLVRAIHARGIMINASMVFGLDGDGPDTFQRTLNWLVKMKISTLTSHILTPYPGTALYETMHTANRITSHNLSLYNTAHVIFKPLGMTPNELYKGYRRMYRQFYSFANILRRYPDSKAQRMPYLLFNLFYRKFGAFTSALTQVIPMGWLGKLSEKMSYKV